MYRIVMSRMAGRLAPDEGRLDARKRLTELLHHERRRQPQHPVTEPAERVVPAGVLPLAPLVTAAIDFHDEAMCGRKEVHDVAPDDHLPAERHTVQLTATQRAPEPRFRHGGRTAEAVSESGERKARRGRGTRAHRLLLHSVWRPSAALPAQVSCHATEERHATEWRVARDVRGSRSSAAIPSAGIADASVQNAPKRSTIS